MTKRNKLFLLGTLAVLLAIVAGLWIANPDMFSASFNYAVQKKSSSKTLTIAGTSGDWQNWVNTGYQVVAGKTYRLSASGEICFLSPPPDNDCSGGRAHSNPSGWCDGADCSNLAYCANFPDDCVNGNDGYLDFSHAAILISLTPTPDWDEVIKVTDHPTYTATESGTLYLVINDHNFSDNTGSYQFTISKQ